MISNCLQCKKEFKVKPATKGLFCSLDCYHLNMVGRPHGHRTVNGLKAWNKGMKFPEKSGMRHFAWKGGTSRGYKTGYYSAEYKNWRKAVFERDDYVCRECGLAGYITAHHIKSFAYYPELRYKLFNGLTLCETCHSKTDNYKGRARRIGRSESLLILK